MAPKLEMAPNKRGPKLKRVRFIGAHEFLPVIVLII